MKINKAEKKIMEMGLFIGLPINCQVLFTSSELSVLNVIRHLNNIKSSCISISLFRLYTGLSKATIQQSLRSLEAMGVIEKGSTCKAGTFYIIRYSKLGSVVESLNKEANPVCRLMIADNFRGKGREINQNLITEFLNTPFNSR